MITAEDYRAWAVALPDEDDAARSRALREREFAQLYADHDRLLAERGALDVGDLVLRAVGLLRDAARARTRRRPLPPRARRRVGGPNYAQGLLLVAAGRPSTATSRWCDDDQAIYRFRGAATKNLATSRRAPRRDGGRAWSAAPLPGADPQRGGGDRARRSRTASRSR